MPSAASNPISARTRLCAVFGHPVEHSASPAMQNAGIDALGLDWRYLACEVVPARLRDALSGAAAMRFLGVNLTVPHKLLAMEMMDALDDSARMWGAVNTVRFEGRGPSGVWRPLAELTADTETEVRMQGFNTDADAIIRAIQEDLGLDLRRARVLLLGAGGAGRVAGLRLAAEGVAELWLVNRTESKAHALAEELPRVFPASPTRGVVGYPMEPLNLVINATSAGLRPGDPLPFDPQRLDLRRVQAAYDMIYRPAETSFLRMARLAGCRTANGLGMLLHQGAASLALWSGQTPPLDVMRRALWMNVYGAAT